MGCCPANRELVIIPIYNEQRYIEEIVMELYRWYCGDVLCIDDGSTDTSPTILKRLESTRLIIIRHEKNHGYGSSLIEGFKYAADHHYEKLVTMDCDWQHEPHFVPTFFSALTDVDVVSGSRYLEENPDNSTPPADRRNINSTVTALVNEYTHFGITDAFCGFKALKVCAAKKLPLDEQGYAFPLQFWVQVHHFGLKVRELAVPRIYIDSTRTFGGHLDNPEIRLAHYKEIFEREKRRWQKA